MILAIDPGNESSAYAVLDNNLYPLDFDKCDNHVLLRKITDGELGYDIDHFAIEMVASYGMAVGQTVFETVFWIGRYWEAVLNNSANCIYMQKIYRKDEKMNLCGSMRAKDGNIRQALIDRFGPVGTKKNPGWFYGFKRDIWAAYAVGCTYHDLYLKGA